MGEGGRVLVGWRGWRGKILWVFVGGVRALQAVPRGKLIFLTGHGFRSTLTLDIVILTNRVLNIEKKNPIPDQTSLEYSADIRLSR